MEQLTEKENPHFVPIDPHTGLSTPEVEARIARGLENRT